MEPKNDTFGYIAQPYPISWPPAFLILDKKPELHSLTVEKLWEGFNKVWSTGRETELSLERTSNGWTKLIGSHMSSLTPLLKKIKQWSRTLKPEVRWLFPRQHLPGWSYCAWQTNWPLYHQISRFTCVSILLKSWNMCLVLHQNILCYDKRVKRFGIFYPSLEIDENVFSKPRQ